MINKILVAVDRSQRSQSVFEHALSLAQATDAKLMLLHILSLTEPEHPITPNFTYYPLVQLRDYGLYQREFTRYERHGLEFLRHIAREAEKNGIKPEFTQLTGNPGQIICELAHNWSADLIVVGSRGLKGLKEMFLGSVSNYVTHHANCSVFIVRQLLDSASETASAQAEL
ncbi:MAG: universal stress protein, partial [Cyanobacteria bacterium P01_A01_bin.83]